MSPIERSGGGGGGTTSPLTTKGDVYTFSTVNARLPVGTNTQVLTANSAATTGNDWEYPPGHEFDYVTTSTSLTITATTEGTAQTFLTGNAVTYDGATRVIVAVYVPWVTVNSSNAAVPVILDNATVLGWFGQLGGGQATSGSTNALSASIILTPSNASHTFSLNFWKTAGTASANCGVGGSGANVNAYLRVTKA